MSSVPAVEGPSPLPPGLETAEKGKKKRDKVRSAWISFVGRIVAQFVGAAATIMLGLVVLQKYQATSAHDSEPSLRDDPSAAAVEAPIRQRAEQAPTAVVVLPFENFSTHEAYAALAPGVTEAIIASLAQTNGLRVISRTSSMLYTQLSKPLPAIARELAVDWVVEGSVVVSGGRARVISQLIDAETDEHIWANSYDQPFVDLLSLQSSLAPAVAREVHRAIVQHERFRRWDRAGRNQRSGSEGQVVAAH